MFFKSAFLSSLLLASAVLVNGQYRHRSLSLSRIEQRGDANSNNQATVGTAGAVFSSKNVRKVNTTFTVPALHENNGGSALVVFGLDVGTCDNALAVGFALDQTKAGPNGDTYYAVAQFQNDTANPQIFNKLSFSAGDKVTIIVAATSTKSGTVIIENATKHRAQHINLKTQSHIPLCMSGAGVAIGAIQGNSQSEWDPLPNFGTLTFKNTELVTSSGVLKLANIPSHDISQFDMELPKGKNEVVVVKTSISHGHVVFKQQK